MIMTLGELIQTIKRKVANNQDLKTVWFDFVNFHPTCLASYRGYYDQLAIGYAKGKAPSVKDFLLELEDAVGKTFQGYKGGDFTMSESTPVWVANNGEAGSTAICDVIERCGDLILITKLIND